MVAPVGGADHTLGTSGRPAQAPGATRWRSMGPNRARRITPRVAPGATGVARRTVVGLPPEPGGPAPVEPRPHHGCGVVARPAGRRQAAERACSWSGRSGWRAACCEPLRRAARRMPAAEPAGPPSHGAGAPWLKAGFRLARGGPRVGRSSRLCAACTLRLTRGPERAGPRGTHVRGAGETLSRAPSRELQAVGAAFRCRATRGRGQPPRRGGPPPRAAAYGSRRGTSGVCRSVSRGGFQILGGEWGGWPRLTPPREPPSGGVGAGQSRSCMRLTSAASSSRGDA